MHLVEKEKLQGAAARDGLRHRGATQPQGRGGLHVRLGTCWSKASIFA